MRKYLYIGIFLACVLPIAWPSGWWITWPKGWWSHTWKTPTEVFSKKRPTGVELKIGKNMLHIKDSGEMTFGKITKLRKEPSGLFSVYLQNDSQDDSGEKKLSAHNGTWIDIDEVLKREYFESRPYPGWE
jgi:hypothetical protein